MNTIKEVVETYQEKVMNSYPSIFTKGDVQHLLLEMLLDIEKVPRETKVEFDIQEFKEDLFDTIERCIENYDIEDNVELEMNGREIYVSFDSSSLKDEVVDNCRLFFDQSQLRNLINSTESMI